MQLYVKRITYYSKPRYKVRLDKYHGIAVVWIFDTVTNLVTNRKTGGSLSLSYVSSVLLMVDVTGIMWIVAMYMD